MPITVAAAALALVGACGGHAEPAAAPHGSPFERFAATTPRVGEAAPDFELAAIDGRRVRLKDELRRGPVVVIFGSFT